MDDRQIAIKKIAVSRDIKYLVHFTPIENLESILSNGILSRDNLKEKDYKRTDNDRIDGKMDMISTSITFPNYKMFYKKRNFVQSKGWCVIKISSSVLWECECYFYPSNASSNKSKELKNNRYPEHLEMMFYEDGRSFLTKNNQTTDVQAEVMVRGKIPAKYIECICIERQINNIPKINRPIVIDGKLFGVRSDCRNQ